MTDPDDVMNDMDVSPEQELNTILPGSDPLDGLVAEHQGGLEYTVLSVRDGEPTLHHVEIGRELSCTCEDKQFNREGREACKHICKAVLADRMDPGELAVSELVNVTATISQASEEARSAAREARDTADELDTGLAKVRDAEAGQAAETSETPASDPSYGNKTPDDTSSHSDSADAIDAAETLQNAFDSVVDGFETEANEGVVWVNKTPDAPDELPGPGNMDSFEVFLQSPDSMEYVYDDHEYAGAEPGQYFGNMIKPENVEAYISEVLE